MSNDFYELLFYRPYLKENGYRAELQVFRR